MIFCHRHYPSLLNFSFALIIKDRLYYDIYFRIKLISISLHVIFTISFQKAILQFSTLFFK